MKFPRKSFFVQLLHVCMEKFAGVIVALLVLFCIVDSYRTFTCWLSGFGKPELVKWASTLFMLFLVCKDWVDETNSRNKSK